MFDQKSQRFDKLAQRGQGLHRLPAAAIPSRGYRATQYIQDDNEHQDQRRIQDHLPPRRHRHLLVSVPPTVAAGQRLRANQSARRLRGRRRWGCSDGRPSAQPIRSYQSKIRSTPEDHSFWPVVSYTTVCSPANAPVSDNSTAKSRG